MNTLEKIADLERQLSELKAEVPAKDVWVPARGELVEVADKDYPSFPEIRRSSGMLSDGNLMTINTDGVNRSTYWSKWRPLPRPKLGLVLERSQATGNYFLDGNYINCFSAQRLLGDKYPLKPGETVEA